MSSTDRQNNLLVSEDWQKIYQTFKNANFQSYDFENLRRIMVDYLRTNYSDDFNDYIESSEYLALIDLIAFVGQSIAFRVDLNARENFLELAERRESVLRLAKLIGYNATRNKPSQGLLKINTISTTENVLDTNGRNLAGQFITWNDPSNINWYDQFIKIINSAFLSTNQFGNPIDSAKIYNVPTAQYRFNSANVNVPIYSFNKTISGKTMNFEVTSTTFKGQNYVYEEAPKLGNSMACIFKDDGYGAGSSGTGFFFNFIQGSLNQGTFTIDQPSSNQTIDIDSDNVNNNDIWLYQLDTNTGAENTLWTKLPALAGNNIIYNSINTNTTTVYSVSTRTNDNITLNFGDGTFGQLPVGTFKVYYRISNGLSYTINPSDIVNVSISIPYVSVKGQNETLTLSLNLPSSVQNSALTESNTHIKNNAPAVYYTQNRMVTGEDYNISPLASSTAVAKIKALNRSSSGISRYFDLIDPTGKYSSTNLYGGDGILYKDEYLTKFNFSYQTKNDIEGEIKNIVVPILSSAELKNLYYSYFKNYVTTSLSISWYVKSSDSNASTGYVGDSVTTTPYQVGSYTNTILKYCTSGSLIKFIAPTGYYFDLKNKNKLTQGPQTVAGSSSYIWAEVVSVIDDGTSNKTGVLQNGLGPITLAQNIPQGAIVSQIIPKFTTVLSNSVIATMIDLISENKFFGLRYDADNQLWKIIFESNLNLTNNFNLGNQGSTANLQTDSSWFILFTTDNINYTVTTRNLRYIFESAKEISFYFENDAKIYDIVSGSIVNDNIKILSVNQNYASNNGTDSFTNDINWKVSSKFVGLDGYTDPKKLIITYTDEDNNGTVDNPQIFDDILAESTGSPLSKYIVQQKYNISLGQQDYKYVANNYVTGPVIFVQTDPNDTSSYSDGQYFYITSTNVVKKYNLTTGELIPTLDYKIYKGRDNLKFQYTHSADYDSRIDPGSSNIIDLYVLTSSYDTNFRQWLAGASTTQPLPPSATELSNLLSTTLNPIKSISDEIVYHPVSYTLLFGALADISLQANFNVIINNNSVVSESDVKARILTAINSFFALENWNFGDTFYFSELATYVINQLTPDITGFVIVPVQPDKYFGSLFQIECPSNKIFISSATTDNIKIVTGFTSDNLKTVAGSASLPIVSQTITSSINGGLNV